MLLFLGAVFSLFGFLTEFFICIADYASEVQLNYLGERFPSGHNFFPATVAEVIHDFMGPRYTVFFAFCSLAGVCLLMSSYPQFLKNVDVGDKAKWFGTVLVGWQIPWIGFRQYAPSLSLIVMALIPTSRASAMGYGGVAAQMTVYLHLIAFVVFVGSYILCEVNALGKIKLHKTELQVRCVLIMFCLMAFILFELCGIVTGLDLICCGDVWLVPNATEAKNLKAMGHVVEAAVALRDNASETRVLYDTARGAALGLKMTQYTLQNLACVFVSLSLLAIWYFSAFSNHAEELAPSAGFDRGGMGDNERVGPPSRMTSTTTPSGQVSAIFSQMVDPSSTSGQR